MPGDLDGSERGTDIGGGVYIVNADHRHVVRNLQLMVAQRFQHTYRAQVVRAEIRLGHHALVKAHVHIFVRHLDAERRVDNIVSRYRQAKLLHAGEIAVVAVFIDERGGAAVCGSADKADTLISAGGQMPYGGLCTAQTVAEDLVKGLVDRVQPCVDDMLDVALDEIFTQSDFISLNQPVLPETIGMLNEERLRSMKKTAYVVNAARCQLVNFEDLKKALREKWIAGAAMDAIEPFNMDDKELLSLDNVILSSHLGGHTYKCIHDMGVMAADGAYAVLHNIDTHLELKKSLY